MDYKDISKIIEMISTDEELNSSYKNGSVTLNQPFENEDKTKLLGVYAKNQAGETVLVKFLDKDYADVFSDPSNILGLKEQYKCDIKQDPSTPNYWMCKILNLHIPFADSVKSFEHKVFFDYANKKVKSVRDGVQEYRGIELGIQPYDKVFTVYRAPETITKIVGLLDGLPLIEDHIDPKEAPAEDTINGSIEGTEIVEFNEGYKDSTLYLENTVNLNDKGLETLSKGKRQLSLGYLGKLKEHNIYDFEQFEIMPTHLAIVDRARGGDVLTFEDKKTNKDNNMEYSFIDEDGKISLQKVADMAGSLQEALKNAPLEEIVAVMPTLQALVASAKSNDPSLQTEEVVEKDEAVESEDMESKSSEGEEEEMKDMEYEKKDEKEESFEDSQKFIDAVNDAVSKKLKTVEKAKQFLPETYNFVDSSINKIMHDSVKEETGQTFEDSEIAVAFKMLKKQTSNYQNFGDEQKDAWADMDNKEI